MIKQLIASYDKIAYIVFTKLTMIDNYKGIYVLIDNYDCSTYQKGRKTLYDLSKYKKYAVIADLYIVSYS